MKANEAPEKLYLFENPITETPDDRWLSKRSGDTDVEYIRKDAFIEKAAEYLSYHLDTSKIDVNYKFDFIEEFRKAMQGE